MAAAAVMQLVDEGKVRLDAPIATYLPNAPHGNEITVRQLLALTAGLPEYLPLHDLPRLGTATTPATNLARVAGAPLACKPGSQWMHSNTDYLLLGLLVEAVSGEP